MKKKLILIVLIVILLIINTLLTTYGTSKAANIGEIRNLTVAYNTVMNIKYRGMYISTQCVKDNKENVAYKLQYNLNGPQIQNQYEVTISEKKETDKEINNKNLIKIIKCGYPYKTPEEIGVNDEKEAKMATQEAINYLLQDRNWEDYEVLVEEERNFFNGIKNIVNMANELESVNQEKIVCVENNEIDIIDKNFSSQEYMLQTDAIDGQYEVQIDITETNNKNPEVYVTDINNNPKTTFQINEKFKIIMKKSPETMEGKFKIKVNAKLQEVVLLLAKSNRDLMSDYVIPETEEKRVEITYDTTYTNINNALHIYVIEKNTGAPINNAVFELTNELTNEKMQLQSNNNGSILVENLQSGKYKLKQISTIEGHTISEKIIDIQIDSDSDIVIKIENEKRKYQINENTFTPTFVSPDKETEEPPLEDEVENNETSNETKESETIDNTIKIEPDKTEKENKVNDKKLPKTGM